MGPAGCPHSISVLIVVLDDIKNVAFVLSVSLVVNFVVSGFWQFLVEWAGEVPVEYCVVETFGMFRLIREHCV